MNPGAQMDRFGPYILRETLGHGPSGTVYRATGSDTGREIALKVVPLRQQSECDSLLRDLRATNSIQPATSLRHPGIVRVERVNAIAGFMAIEMEYVRGMNLRDLLGIAGLLPPERASAITLQILDALAFAHARGIAHGDLKPTNVLVRCDGMAKLSDFGRRCSHPDPARVRSAPIHCYAAPEELEPDAIPDRRSDVWSVAVLLFQMLTGQLPFPISDPHDLRAWQRGLNGSEPKLLPTNGSGSPALLQATLARALRYDPAERFANAREFLNAVLATGLCAGMIDTDDDDQEHEEATYKHIDKSIQTWFDADEETALPEAIRAFAQTNPDWDDSGDMLNCPSPVGRPELSADCSDPHSAPRSLCEPYQSDEVEPCHESTLRRVESIEEDPEATAFRTRADSPSRADSPLECQSDAEWSVILQSEQTSSASGAHELHCPINPRDGAELIYIPAGDFLMGMDGFSEEYAPLRRVKMVEYFIYRFPVTVGQYRHYCEETAFPMPRASWHTDDLEPIVGITWHEATRYCEWADVRLPTEAQWEKAARGVDGRVFPWGDQFDQRSNHRFVPKNADKAVPVGGYPLGSSPYGVMDVVGNIQQWCHDYYDDDYYRSAPDENPPGPSVSARRSTTKAGLVQKLFNLNSTETSQATELRVVRGSSWKDHHESFAFTFRREAFPAESRPPCVGFRCVAVTSRTRPG